MTTASSRPVVKLSSPGALAAAVPLLCGFWPHESLVLLSLRGPRRRLGLTARLDLPPSEQEQQVARSLVQRMAADGAAAIALVVLADEAHDRLVAEVERACDERGLPVEEAVHVRDGRWTSYLCSGSCCPVEGTPLPPVPARLQAEKVLAGRAVLASREELIRSLAPPVLLAAAQARQAVERAADEVLDRLAEVGRDRLRAEALAELVAAVELVDGGGSVPPAAAARVAVLLHDVAVRDDLAVHWLSEPDGVRSLLGQVVRSVPPPDDAPACALLAWLCYAQGDGATANVALDRALTSDPGCSLALLLRQGLDAGLPPEEVRRTIRPVSG